MWKYRKSRNAATLTYSGIMLDEFTFDNLADMFIFILINPPLADTRLLENREIFTCQGGCLNS